MARAKAPVQLDPKDAFEKLIIPIVEMNRRKRADYAQEGSLFHNFERNAATMDLEGYTPLEDCLSMVARKLGRIVNLRGRSAANETVVDSYLDMCVYSILAYGLALDAAESEG